MSGSSGNTSTTSTTSSPPASVLSNYNNLVGATTALAGEPLAQYSGSMVAGFTPQQQSGYQTIDNSQGIGTPYINAAAQQYGAATTPLWPTLPQFSADTVNQYMSPYTSDVTGALTNLYNSQNATQQSQIAGDATSKNAYGGDREAVAQALATQQENLAQAPTLANVQQQGYQSGIGEFNTQQQQQLSAEQGNAWLNSQAAAGLGSLGTEAQNSALTGAQANISAGAQQQQLAQEQLNVPYQQFLQTQQYPYQQLSFAAPIIEGTGSASGGTGATTSPGPSTVSQVAGLGLAGAGAYGLYNSLSGGSSGTNYIDPSIFSGGSTGSLSSALGVYRDGGRITNSSRPSFAMGGGGIGTPSVPGIDPGAMVGGGVPTIDLSYIPQPTAAASHPSSFGLSVNQPVTTQTQTNSSGGSGIAGDLGALASIAKIGSIFLGAKTGGRIGYDAGGGIGTAGAVSTMGTPGMGGLPAILPINLDFIPKPAAAQHGSGPPRAPNAPATPQGNDMQTFLNGAKELKGAGLLDWTKGIGSSDTASAGGRIGFDAGGGVFDSGGGVDWRQAKKSTPPDLLTAPESTFSNTYSNWGPIDKAIAESDYAFPENNPTKDTSIAVNRGPTPSVTTPSAPWHNPTWDARHGWHSGQSNPIIEEGPSPRGKDYPSTTDDPTLTGEEVPFRRGGIVGHFDAGGAASAPVGAAIAFGGAPPNQTQQFQQLIELPLSRLQEMAVQYPPNTQQGQLVARAIQQKQMTPGSGTTPTQGGIGGQQQPAAQQPGTTPSGTAQLATSPQDYGGTAHAMAIGGAADDPGYVTPDELDPHPTIDHSGDTVKIHYPSEGKTLDLGLPSIPSQRPHRAAGGGTFPEVSWSPSGQWSLTPGSLGSGASNAPAASTTQAPQPTAPAITPAAQPGFSFTTAANGASLPIQSPSITNSTPNAQPGGGIGNWMVPLQQYTPPGGGQTGPGGATVFPSNNAYLPNMHNVLAELAPGNTIPPWAGGPLDTGTAAGAGTGTGDAGAAATAAPAVVVDDSASAVPIYTDTTVAGGKRGGTVAHFADAGTVSTTDDASPSNLSPSALSGAGNDVLAPMTMPAFDMGLGLPEDAAKTPDIAKPKSFKMPGPGEDFFTAASERLHHIGYGASGMPSESAQTYEPKFTSMPAVGGAIGHALPAADTSSLVAPDIKPPPPPPETKFGTGLGNIAAAGEYVPTGGGIGTASAEPPPVTTAPPPPSVPAAPEPAAAPPAIPRGTETAAAPSAPVSRETPAVDTAAAPPKSAPIPASQWVATGDSTGSGYPRFAGTGGTWAPNNKDITVDAGVGRSPQQVLDSIKYHLHLNPDYYRGVMIPFTTGVSNDTSQVGLVQEQIKTLLGAGAAGIQVAGVGNRAGYEGGKYYDLRPYNPQIEAAVKAANDPRVWFGGALPAVVHPDPAYYKGSMQMAMAHPTDAAPQQGTAASPAGTLPTPAPGDRPAPRISEAPVGTNGIVPEGAPTGTTAAQGNAPLPPVMNRVADTLMNSPEARQLGLTKGNVAGILGNTVIESPSGGDINPTAYNKNDPHGGSHAIFQWQPDRLANGQSWAQRNGISDFMTNPEAQARFGLYEVLSGTDGSGGRTLAALKAAGDDPTKSALAWAHFERGAGYQPDHPEYMIRQDERNVYAQQIYNALNGGQPFKMDVAPGRGGGRPAGAPGGSGAPDQLVGSGGGQQPGTINEAPPLQQASSIAQSALANTPPEHRDGMKQWMNSPWFLAFLAGAGMLASKSPFPGVALGEGLMTAAKGAESIVGQANTADWKKAELNQGQQRIDQTGHYQAGELAAKQQQFTQSMKAEQDRFNMQMSQLTRQSDRDSELARHNQTNEALTAAYHAAQMAKPMGGYQKDAQGNVVLGTQQYNPLTQRYEFTAGSTVGRAPPPAAAVQSFANKKAQWLSIPGQEHDELHAIEFANGQRQMTEQQIQVAATTAAQKAMTDDSTNNIALTPSQRQAKLNKLTADHAQIIRGGPPPAAATTAQPAAPAAAAPATPARPASVPNGAAYSPSRQMWRDPQGHMYNAQGQPVAAQ